MAFEKEIKMTEKTPEINTNEIIKKIKEKSKDKFTIKDFIDFAFSFKFNNFTIVPIQKKTEIQTLLGILEQNKPKNVLEIGTSNGGTLFLLSRVADSNALICSIDLPEGSYGGELFPTWKNLIYRSFATKNQEIHILREDSHKEETYIKVKNLLGEKKFDFILIDGDHSFDGVSKDFEMYSSLVAEGGIIAFHDINPGPEQYVGGVPQFWNKIKNEYNFIEIKDEEKIFGYGIGLIFNELKSQIPTKYGKIIHVIESIKERETEIVKKEYNLQTNLIIGHPITSLLYVYLQRDDLQQLFPEAKDAVFKNLLNWALRYGVEEYKEILSQHKKYFTQFLSDVLEREENQNKISIKLKDTEEELSGTRMELKNTKEELSGTRMELKNTKEELSGTRMELKNTKEELSGTRMELKNTKEELSGTRMELKNTKEELSGTRMELNNLQINYEEIKNSVVFQILKKFSNFIDKLFPSGTKRGDLANKIRMGLLVRQRFGNKVFIKKFKNEIFKKSEKNIKLVPNHKNPEEDFFSGLDIDLNFLKTSSNRVIKFSGWCYHKNFKIKKIFINFLDEEKPISNINLPRWDVYENQKDPSSFKSGFWTIIDLPKSDSNIKFWLRIILDNGKQFTKSLGEIKKN